MAKPHIECASPVNKLLLIYLKLGAAESEACDKLNE